MGKSSREGDGLSLTWVSIFLAVGAGVCYVAFVLYGTWIDGRRQAVREKGLHPVTEPSGEVHAQEEENGNGSKRS